MSTPIRSQHRHDPSQHPAAADHEHDLQTSLQHQPSWPQSEWREGQPYPSEFERLQHDVVAQYRRARRERDPYFVPPPPPRPRRSMATGIIGSMVGAALFAGFLFFYLTDSAPSLANWKALTSDVVAMLSPTDQRTEPKEIKAAGPEKVQARATPRLVVEGANAENNNEISIGARVEGPVENATVVVSGLAPGTTLSAGRPWGATGWIVPAAEVGRTMLRPPRGFSGTMEYALTLRGADNAVIERQAIRLEWTAGSEARNPAPGPEQRVTREPAPARELVASREPGAVPAQRPAPEQPSTPARTQQAALETPPPAPAAPVTAAPIRTPAAAEPARQLSDDEIAVLLKRGQQLLESGDLSGARLLLRRAAEAHNATAAFALAATYDPNVLRELGVFGSAPDIAQAREWYERAREYGSKDAPRRLEQLASQNR